MTSHSESQRAIQIIGHRHPDTDSICSAIAYSRLKAQLDPSHKYEPCRAGILSQETDFVLKRFHVPAPRLLLDVSPQIQDVDFRRMEGVDAEMSLRRAWITMRDREVDTLCVVDQNEMLTGLITVRDMTKANMDLIDERILAKSRTSYQNVIETLDATVIAGNAAGKTVTGRITIGSGSVELMEKSISPGDVVIVSNRIDSQLAAIEMNAGCIVVCAGAKVSKTICMLAEERGCMMISTPYNTYVAGQMITQAVPVRHYMVSENLLTFSLTTSVEVCTKVMATVRYRYFPVLDEDGRYQGVVSRRNLLNLQKKQMILVDHNDKSNAVDGIESADVLEIIDHHRISALETDSPVYFRNVPVGCTCTILYQMYRENEIEIDPETAGLMLSAILSDTLLFRSPTSTPADERAARALAGLAGIDMERYATELFEAGGDITGKTPDEVLNADYKIFGNGAIRFGISQGSYMTQKSREASETLVAPCLRQSMEKQGLDYLFCMFTDVSSSTTELLAEGTGVEELVWRAFGVSVQNGKAVLPGVVSRKKQMVPALLRVLRQQEEETLRQKVVRTRPDST